MLKALKKILAGDRKPNSIRSDLGKEFKNKYVRDYLSKEDINTYYSQNETKSAIVERVIRTFRQIMFRYFRHKLTYKYIDVLQDMVLSYNRKPHRSLGGISPSEVNDQNAGEVRLSAYLAQNPSRKRDAVTGKRKPKKKKKISAHFKHKIGDLVRISHKRHPFQRDYQQKWTEEVFKIRRRYLREGIPVYQLKDLKDENIDGSFYAPELQKVRKDENAVWKIEKIIRKRKRRGIQEALVRWLGYPKKFDSWVAMSDIQNE